MRRGHVHVPSLTWCKLSAHEWFTMAMCVSCVHITCTCLHVRMSERVAVCMLSNDAQIFFWNTQTYVQKDLCIHPWNQAQEYTCMAHSRYHGTGVHMQCNLVATKIITRKGAKKNSTGLTQSGAEVADMLYGVLPVGQMFLCKQNSTQGRWVCSGECQVIDHCSYVRFYTS